MMHAVQVGSRLLELFKPQLNNSVNDTVNLASRRYAA